jgi:hypothetical protein
MKDQDGDAEVIPEPILRCLAGGICNLSFPQFELCPELQKDAFRL